MNASAALQVSLTSPKCGLMQVSMPPYLAWGKISEYPQSIHCRPRAHESPHFRRTRKSLKFGFLGRLDVESAGWGSYASAEGAFVHEFLNRVFIDDVHAKRVLSLANGTLGVMSGAALAVSLIGQALAKARGLFASRRSNRSTGC